MGKAKKFLEDFISKIPDEKLSGSAYRQILYKDTDFWLEGVGVRPLTLP
jgi:hypothetical protein